MFVHYDSGSSYFMLANVSPEEHKCFVRSESLANFDLSSGSLKSWSLGVISKLIIDVKIEDTKVIKLYKRQLFK